MIRGLRADSGGTQSPPGRCRGWWSAEKDNCRFEVGPGPGPCRREGLSPIVYYTCLPCGRVLRRAVLGVSSIVARKGRCCGIARLRVRGDGIVACGLTGRQAIMYCLGRPPRRDEAHRRAPHRRDGAAFPRITSWTRPATQGGKNRERERETESKTKSGRRLWRRKRLSLSS